MKKVRWQPVAREFLEERAALNLSLGYRKQKWIEFCEILLNEGFQVFLYEARQTRSKYLTVRKEGRSFKVRFSDHRPGREKEALGDCDFFVGVTHTGVRNTGHALAAVREFFYIKQLKGDTP